MNLRKSGAALLGVAITGALAVCLSAADNAPKPADPGTLIIIDAAGKEQKLKSWKFTQGVRRLSWLATSGDKEDPEKDEKKDTKKDKGPRDKDKTPKGPEALELREDDSTNWREGVLTFVPFSRIKSLSYDYDKKQLKVTVATGDKTEEVLSGTTEFPDHNHLTLEAEVDKGDLGVAEVVYKGGELKGIKGIRFPAPKVEAAAEGRPAKVTVADKKDKHTYKVQDLTALYHVDNGEKTVPTLYFKKTIKIDFSKIKKITADKDSIGSKTDPVWSVSLKDSEENFTLLREPSIDGKTAQLVGLLARVPGGYKLIPVHAIAEIDFEAEKEK